MLAYDNLMHYVLYTSPFGGGSSASPSGGADPNARIAHSSIDAVMDTTPSLTVEQSIDDLRPEYRRMIEGL